MEPIDLWQVLRDIEKDCIIQALKASCSIAGAAKKLGLLRTTLTMRIKVMGLNPYEYIQCSCCERRRRNEVTNSYLE